jgi:hypothetical protein
MGSKHSSCEMAAWLAMQGPHLRPKTLVVIQVPSVEYSSSTPTSVGDTLHSTPADGGTNSMLGAWLK